MANTLLANLLYLNLNTFENNLNNFDGKDFPTTKKL
jgi:hypothetical protein